MPTQYIGLNKIQYRMNCISYQELLIGTVRTSWPLRPGSSRLCVGPKFPPAFTWPGPLQRARIRARYGAPLQRMLGGRNLFVHWTLSKRCQPRPMGTAIGAPWASLLPSAFGPSSGPVGPRCFPVGSRARTVSPQACLRNILRDGGVHGLVLGGT